MNACMVEVFKDHSEEWQLQHRVSDWFWHCRKMERVHAAVTGEHRRHGQLLPLEAYLEEGIPLVLALRGGPPEMVELPEQSLHAFITWANISSPHPALKVYSLNPFNHSLIDQASMSRAAVALSVLQTQTLDKPRHVWPVPKLHYTKYDSIDPASERSVWIMHILLHESS